MGSLNDNYFEPFAKKVGLFRENLDDGSEIMGEVNLFLSSTISFNSGVWYSRAWTKNEFLTSILNDGADTLSGRASFTASVLSPYIGLSYRIPVYFGWVSLGGNVVYGFGEAKLKREDWYYGSNPSIPRSTEQKYKYQANGLGGMFVSSLLVRCSRALSFSYTVGYRYLKTDTLKSNDGEVWYVDYTGETKFIDLDFSGIYLLLTISVVP